MGTDDSSLSQDFYTVEEVAQRHKRDPRSIRRAIKAGNLKAHRFGRCLRIAHTDLIDYENRACNED